jgi:hypothetical protein
MTRQPTAAQMDELKAAAEKVRNSIKGTDIDPAEFQINHQSLAPEKSRLLSNACLRRAWAYGKGNVSLVAAFDNLIEICQR